MKINDTYKNLIPALSADEHSQLEANILQDGIREPLVLWGDTLIDGHNRYEIAQKHGLHYKTVQKEFANETEAREWIIRNQFGRRNISAYDRARLALQLKPIIAEKAEQNLHLSQGQGVKGSQNSVKVIDTQKELAKVAGVSHDTIAKVEKIEQTAPEIIRNELRRDNISINMAHSVTQMDEPDVTEITERIEQGESAKEVITAVKARPHVVNNSGNNEWYTPPDYIEAARQVMGNIDLDPASCELANKVVKADKIYTTDDDGLTKVWRGNVWMNPPYAGELIGKFTEKITQEPVNQAVVLVNNATETNWFNALIEKASAVIFPKGRVKFYMPDGSTGAPLQGQAVIYIGGNPERFISIFRKFGWGALL